MTALDRAALIEAAMKHTHASHGKVCWFGQNCPGDEVVRYDAEQTLDAILPLIADAIEAELRDTVSPGDPDWCQGYGVGMSAAEALVRSLGDEQ